MQNLTIYGGIISYALLMTVPRSQLSLLHGEYIGFWPVFLVYLLHLVSTKLAWPMKFCKTIIWANSNDEKIIDKLNKKFKKTGGDENMNEMDELDELDMLLNEDIKEVKESEILDEIIIVSNIHIFHLDNIKTFKEKIFLETSIQPYLQHICIYYKNTFIPIGYNIVGNVINIKNIVDLQRYEGIPVDQKIYSNKDSIIVNALDNFTLLEQIYNKYGTTTFYLVDLNSFIKPLRGNLEQIIKEKLLILY